MARSSFVHLSLDTSGELINYFISSVAKLWESVNIFVSVVEVFTPSMAKSLVP